MEAGGGRTSRAGVLAGPAAVPRQVGRGARHHPEREDRRQNRQPKIASLVASAKTVAAVVNLARADARHATAPDDWDADPWALNSPDGIVGLRNGQTRRTTAQHSARR
jgi:phage/plasmid-associated DNA primase